jgi:hypothetical protein
MPVPDFQDGVAPSISQLDAWLTEQVISIVTSATRPSGTEGQHIYETDTGRVLWYDGTNWIRQGCLGVTTSTTLNDVVTGGPDDLTGMSVTVTCGANRLIVVKGFVRATTDADGQAGMLRVQESTTTLKAQRFLSAAAAATLSISVETEPFVASAGSHTYKLTGNRASGGTNIDFVGVATEVAYIAVFDVGA